LSGQTQLTVDTIIGAGFGRHEVNAEGSAETA